MMRNDRPRRLKSLAMWYRYMQTMLREHRGHPVVNILMGVPGILEIHLFIVLSLYAGYKGCQHVKTEMILNPRIKSSCAYIESFCIEDNLFRQFSCQFNLFGHSQNCKTKSRFTIWRWRGSFRETTHANNIRLPCYRDNTKQKALSTHLFIRQFAEWGKFWRLP